MIKGCILNIHVNVNLKLLLPPNPSTDWLRALGSRAAVGRGQGSNNEQRGASVKCWRPFLLLPAAVIIDIAGVSFLGKPPAKAALLKFAANRVRAVAMDSERVPMNNNRFIANNTLNAFKWNEMCLVLYNIVFCLYTLAKGNLIFITKFDTY